MQQGKTSPAHEKAAFWGGGEVRYTKVIIKGNPKEIAALVLAVQERQETTDCEEKDYFAITHERAKERCYASSECNHL